ncbi:glycoside hydrolase family 31 protein, partial [Bipolaris oryzae ATCC 44560]
GRTYNFRHYQSETTIPSFISSKTYGFLWNVPSMGHVTLDDNRIQWVTESAMVIDYVVSVAEKGDFRTLVETHSSLTGRAPSFPQYGRGYIQSKTAYINQNEVLRVAEGFKKHKIPVSMIQIDAPHWRAFGDFAFDRLKFPDPALLVETVRKSTNGARIIASIWPLIEPSSESWLDYLSSGLVAGSTQGTGVVEFFNGTAMHLLDYTNPTTRNKTWSKIMDNYYRFGIRDFLLDCTEGGGVGEGFSFKTITMYPLQVVPYSRPKLTYSFGTHSEIGAIFPFYAQKMIHDGMATLGILPGDNEEDKGMSFSRSSWLGSQRLSSVLWNGDVDGSWEAFRAQITTGLNVQLAGITWWASDIGGYYAQTEYHGNISDPRYQELYGQWLQYGTFSPVMRAHGRRKCLPKDQDGFDSCPNEPWSFGEAVFPHITRFIHLRYTMDLYIKALFKEASRLGTPLQRPLFFDFAIVDPYTIMYAEELKNQFMFGPNLLVAPITDPGPSEWRVYLPIDTIQTEQSDHSAKTTVWRDWWSDEIHYGGNFVTLNVSIARMPLFYRGSRKDLLAGKIIG